jgi:hypothetical protein
MLIAIPTPMETTALTYNVRGKQTKLGAGERQVRLGQDRLAIKKNSRKKRKRAETMYVVLPTPVGICRGL